MALKFGTKNAAVITTGTEFTHGLFIPARSTAGVRSTTATAPDAWALNARGTATLFPYLSAVGTTSITVAIGTAGNVDLFAWIWHSSIS